jgi:hypothetical protein
MFFKLVNDFWNKYGWTIIFVVSILVLIIIISFKKMFNIKSSSDISGQSFWSQIFSTRIGQTSSAPRRRPKISKGEDECKKFAEFFFKKPFIKIRPHFLKNPITGAQLELDLYNEELKLAIEYNGSQHYIYNEMMHQGSRDKFQNQQYRDYLKKTMCAENDIDLIIVPFTIRQQDISRFLFDEFKKRGFSPAVL